MSHALDLLPARIREARIKSGRTQSQLASEIGVSQGTVSAWERGCATVSVYHLRQLGRTLGVTTDYLTGSDRHPGPEEQWLLREAARRLSDAQKRAMTQLFESMGLLDAG